MGRLVAIALVMLVTACVPPPETYNTPDVEPGLRFSTTFGDSDGNRYVEGVGQISPGDYQEISLAEIGLNGSPQWIVGIGDGDLVELVVADNEGNLLGLQDFGGRSFEPEPLNLSSTTPGTPPGLVAGRGVLVVMPPVAAGTPGTGILALDSGGLAFVTVDGSVVITDGASNRKLEVDALVDGRLTTSSNRLLAVLTGPTDRYGHGVVGDRVEASGVTFVSLDTQEVVSQVTLESDVFEGLVGMFADLDSDGLDEFIMTVSNADTGARLVVFDEKAQVVAESDPIGQGGRWRHQLAAGPFGPEGEIELVDIGTPHIRGVVEYFTMQEGRLDLVASMSGYSSHTIGSRNLDMATAFDVDGDGQLELIVPTQEKDQLDVLRRVSDGVEVVMTLPLNGVLVTNLMATETAGGQVVLAAGTADGRLLIWR